MARSYSKNTFYPTGDEHCLLFYCQRDRATKNPVKPVIHMDNQHNFSVECFHCFHGLIRAQGYTQTK